MDIVKIQTLISQGKVVELANIDPTQSFIQIGIYQPGNRKIKPSDPNTYSPFVIPLSELGGGGGGVWGTITGLLSNQTDLQAALNTKQNVLGYIPYNSTNPAGYISGITGSDVNTALGYTPYNSSNPAGYIDSAALTPYQLSLGFTPENVANKSIDGTLAANSDTLYSSQKAVKTYVDASVTGLLNDRGNWDASSNLFPTTGGSGPGGSILKGDLWYVSVPGILGGTSVVVGNNFRALVDNPTLSTDWNILNVGLGFIPENIANKGIANGYASLGADGKVPSAQLPNDMVKITKALDSSTLTGTTALSIVDSLLIPANTFKVGVAKLNIRNKWVGTLASTKTTRIYINSINSLVGASLIGTYSAGTGTRSIDMGRYLCIKSTTSFEVFNSGGSYLSAESAPGGSIAPSTITYNSAINNYIIVTVQQGASDSCINSYINFEI